MNNKKNMLKIPLTLPNLGKTNQPDFDINEGALKACSECKCEIFKKFCRIKRIPRLAKNNRTGKDINLEINGYGL